MNEIKIPDGHKATIIGGTIRIEPIEQKFHRGDIVYDPFMEGVICILYSHRRRDESASFIARYFIGSRILYMNDDGKLERNARLATPEEQQILFTALAKEGKRWNAETLEVEEIPKRILVPESISIYTFPETVSHIYGDGLFIAFNKDKQLLGYCDSAYCAEPKVKCSLVKVQCYLQPYKREDLQSGDTAFFSQTFRLSEDITSDLGRYVKIVGKANYKTNKSGEIVQERNHAEWWYKLIPIN